MHQREKAISRLPGPPFGRYEPIVTNTPATQVSTGHNKRVSDQRTRSDGTADGEELDFLAPESALEVRLCRGDGVHLPRVYVDAHVDFLLLSHCRGLGWIQCDCGETRPDGRMCRWSPNLGRDLHYKHAVDDPAKSATYVLSLLAGHGVLAVIEPPAPDQTGVI